MVEDPIKVGSCIRGLSGLQVVSLQGHNHWHSSGGEHKYPARPSCGVLMICVFADIFCQTETFFLFSANGSSIAIPISFALINWLPGISEAQKQFPKLGRGGSKSRFREICPGI